MNPCSKIAAALLGAAMVALLLFMRSPDALHEHGTNKTMQVLFWGLTAAFFGTGLATFQGGNPRILTRLRKTFGKYVMGLGYLEEFWTRKSEINRIYRSKAEHMRRHSCPLILFSQIQRSGGSMMARLFDGHPQCLAHPHELKIGHPRKENWPILSMEDSPDVWISRLFEDSTAFLFRNNYRKAGSSNPDYRELPFLIPPNLVRFLFLTLCEQHPPKNSRQILDHYFTAYFNAWLDIAAPSQAPKYITGFTPRMIMEETSMQGFWRDYPDGRLVSVIREPFGWFVSYSKQKADIYPDVPKRIDQWNRSTRRALEEKHARPEQVFLVRFEDLLHDTPAAMRQMAAFLGLEYHSLLTEPTYRGWPVVANSHFEMTGHAVGGSALDRGALLDEDQRQEIDRLTKDVRDEIDRFFHSAGAA